MFSIWINNIYQGQIMLNLETFFPKSVCFFIYNYIYYYNNLLCHKQKLKLSDMHIV